MANFLKLQDRVFSLYSQRRYREALEAVRSAVSDFPQRASRTSFWIACLRGRLGETDEALEALHEAMGHGIWWAPEKLQTDPDLEPLRGRTAFSKIVSECEIRREVARGDHRSRYRFIRRTGRAGARGTIVALHGRGENRDETARRWAPVTSAGLQLAAIQSSQVFDMEGYCWDDVARSERDVLGSLGVIQARYDLGANLILAGFSQGAGLAIHLGVSGLVEGCRGLIAVAPIMWPSSDESETATAAAAAPRDLKVWLLAGERDERRAFTERLSKALSRMGLSCRLVVQPAMGHAFPPNFAALVQGACDYVSGNPPA